MKTSSFIRPPGIFIFIMAAIWALPFAVRSILENPLEFTSHFYHIVFLGIPAITAIILNLNNKIMERWTRNEIWSRVLIVCAGYGISSIATVLVVMDWGFYGGDAGGSYALFLLPSVALYAGIGICIGVLMTVFKQCNIQKRSNQAETPEEKTPR